jgi:lipoprotein signal peptidase
MTDFGGVTGVLGRGARDNACGLVFGGVTGNVTARFVTGLVGAVPDIVGNGMLTTTFPCIPWAHRIGTPG